MCANLTITCILYMHTYVWNHTCQILNNAHFLHEETTAQLPDLGGSSRQVKTGWGVRVGAGKGVNGQLEMSREAEARVMEAFWRGQLHVVNESEGCQCSCPGHACADRQPEKGLCRATLSNAGQSLSCLGTNIQGNSWRGVWILGLESAWSSGPQLSQRDGQGH